MNFDEWKNEAVGEGLNNCEMVRSAWNAALDQARIECVKNEPRPGGGVGARTCFEIRDAIEDLSV